MSKKTLGNTTSSQAKDNVKDLKIWGAPDMWKLISKASSQSEGWMVSTKAMEVPHVGCLVNVTRQQGDNISEALELMPYTQIMSQLDDEGNVIARYLAPYESDPTFSTSRSPEAINTAVQLFKDIGDGFDTDKISDGYHTFGELYEFRKQYNRLLFNSWAKDGLYNVHKSKKHHDGEECFGVPDKWFIVVAVLPTGQISNHYKMSEWDSFKMPDHPTALFPFDGHTPQDVLERLAAL
jgi:hypothetical protein